MTSSPIAGEREAFETWARSRCHDLSRVDDDYSIVRTHVAWLAWQARAALLEPVGEGKELTPKQIEAGWHQTFSTSNPFCPCDLKTFTKAVRWAEWAKSNGGMGS